MQEYVTTAQIAAPPERVWATLADAASYKDWNPEIIAVDGDFAAGKVKVHVKLGDGAVRKLPQRVVTFAPPTTMVWVGGLPLGLFVGRRTFTVSPAAGGTEFRMHIHMSGPLSGPILKSMGDRQPELDKFSAALKRRVEGR